ncbi:uncharacterized protein L3040_005630 [Drepanopeziza brunnea f. sp. 'multigermtubi']|uniref:C6 transcription factor OefC n=1 Tax=Marssonina brunnea f. sp. multigermtubi (strain MB_m1) TaxID=1072389 RepID=K1W955_MARBU|nr:C6 transcription factor OefC [Drepanopeziza brunnea f. sp. 'multigermtubi' MB_m1]EKD13755.1 C6 transcription factor OefC [Drepanopeziza brunnea f. sp. 'multigermtubi' MB_m1]KAJ5041076.1 hypothetical protein L3040_005630 [Drepanopeziza brunnea f. sp. 'multigermtubi']
MSAQTQIQSSERDTGISRMTKRQIRRTRTGCKTCRRRRKKCDEEHPFCQNCMKSTYRCEGYDVPTTFETGGTKRKVKRKPVPGSTSFEAQLMLYDTNSRAGYDYDEFINYTSSSSEEFPISDAQDLHVYTRQLDGNIEVTYDPFDPISYYEGIQPLENYQEFLPPPELPFPIRGINTPVRRRLYSHFTSILSPLLTTCPGVTNPFNSIVIPLALSDETIMDSILSLAGSHLLKLQPSVADMEVIQDSQRLHSKVVQSQSNRVRDLSSHALTYHPSREDRTLEVIFATSLLLCLYEICEGSGGNAWHEHLSDAEKIITLATTPSQISTMGPAPPPNLSAIIDPFLLEFYLYHESLATVTVPFNPTKTTQHQRIADLLYQEPSLVGVQDGLHNFVTRISALRSEAESSQRDAHGRPDGHVVIKAENLFYDLEAWRHPPQLPASRPRNLMTGFYQTALSIWLFSIINPECRSDPVIQEAVGNIVAGMEQIGPRDGVLACMLFPLFVAGSAAITTEHRKTISAQFRRLKAWSALGNIDLTFRVVEKMWRDHDRGLRGSWDWVKQLEHTSLLVT